MGSRITLWTYAREYKGLLVLVLILAAINQTFSLLDPLLFRFVVDNYAMRIGEVGADAFIRGVLLLIGGMIGVAFISRTAKTFQDYYVNKMSQRVSTNIYARGVAHTLALPYSVFEDRRSGEILQRLQKARTDSQKFIVDFVNTFFVGIIGVLFVIVYSFSVSVWAGLGFVLTIPILGLTAYLVSRSIKDAQKRIVEASSVLAGSTTETLRNVELVKSLGLEKQEIGRLNDANDKILALELEKIKIMRRLSFVQGTVVNGLRSGLLFLMLYLLLQGDITLGAMMSLFFYSFFVFAPLGQLGEVASSYQQASASMDSLNAIMQIPAHRERKGAKKTSTLRKIEFSGVSFTYPGAKKPAVSSANIVVTSGETIALAGASGSGKSTMMKLLLGLYEPTAGTIRFNNEANVDKNDLRNRIGLVTQETQLFAGTIRENLLFAAPSATDEECLAALKAASIMHIVDRTGDGLETRIGEGGVKLSGGERQRVAIARALLRKPELLIFDEATSALDSLSEKEITKTIDVIRKTRPDLMIVLIAHRLSTLSRAERIYVLENGRIAEQGSQAALLKKKGLYYAFWRQQQGEKA